MTQNILSNTEYFQRYLTLTIITHQNNLPPITLLCVHYSILLLALSHTFDIHFVTLLLHLLKYFLIHFCRSFGTLLYTF